MNIEDLNLPVTISQHLTQLLGQIGIELSLLLIQLFTLVLCIAGCWFFIRRLRRNGIKDLLSLLITTAFILFAIGILISLINNSLNPLPGHVSGEINVQDRTGANRYLGLTVELIDFEGHNIAREQGLIDSRNGFFALSYQPDIADYPRFIRVSGVDCQTHDHVLTRSRLLSKDAIHIKLMCQPSS